MGNASHRITIPSLFIPIVLFSSLGALSWNEVQQEEPCIGDTFDAKTVRVDRWISIQAGRYTKLGLSVGQTSILLHHLALDRIKTGDTSSCDFVTAKLRRSDLQASCSVPITAGVIAPRKGRDAQRSHI